MGAMRRKKASAESPTASASDLASASPVSGPVATMQSSAGNAVASSPPPRSAMPRDAPRERLAEGDAVHRQPSPAGTRARPPPPAPPSPAGAAPRARARSRSRDCPSGANSSRQLGERVRLCARGAPRRLLLHQARRARQPRRGGAPPPIPPAASDDDHALAQGVSVTRATGRRNGSRLDERNRACARDAPAGLAPASCRSGAGAQLQAS